jgi:hypothetical protein
VGQSQKETQTLGQNKGGVISRQIANEQTGTSIFCPIRGETHSHSESNNRYVPFIAHPLVIFHWHFPAALDQEFLVTICQRYSRPVR